MLRLEHLFFDPSAEPYGIRLLIWEDKDELARCLVVVRALLQGQSFEDILLSTDTPTIERVRLIVETRRLFDDQPNSFLSLFIQQATTATVGPFLNGSRRPLAESPGTLLVVRSADFPALLRAAPDMTSFVVHRMFDAAELLAPFDSALASLFSADLPPTLVDILNLLPGDPVAMDRLNAWVKACLGTGANR